MTLIIAEAGVNHNGREDLALQLVDAAHMSGADIVKFQTFTAKRLVTTSAEQAAYQIKNTGVTESQMSMLSRLELSYESHHKLLNRCDQLGIEFLSTAFDSESLDFLVNDLGVKRLKIPSGEITNAPLVLEHAKTGLDIIVSTGMANLSDIESVLGVIAFGYMGETGVQPSHIEFAKSYASGEGQALLRDRVTVLHCTTEYPAHFDNINLKVMNTLGGAFGLPIGYSDHSKGIIVPIAAVARGACIIEKHFTLDKTMEGPDHRASLNPVELKEMVSAVRNVERALGGTVKMPTVVEVKNKVVARKSLVAQTDIEKGEVFTPQNIGIKRPGSGMDPTLYWKVLEQNASKRYSAGDLLSE